MGLTNSLKLMSAAALCAAVLLVPTLGLTQDKPDTEDKAISTRQGYMKLVVWEAGPLFGMAKGAMAYDAKTAQTHATNLKTISQYPVERLWLPGTSNADRPGKTRSLPAIWKDDAKFAKVFGDWRAAVTALGSKVGNGQAALAAAVGDLGKSCGGCHKPFRAPKN